MSVETKPLSDRTSGNIRNTYNDMKDEDLQHPDNYEILISKKECVVFGYFREFEPILFSNKDTAYFPIIPLSLIWITIPYLPIPIIRDISMLSKLLTSSSTFLYKGRSIKYYRDYFAAISRLIEEELLKFMKQPKNEDGEPFYKLRYIATNPLFDQHSKLPQLLKNIARTRFQCQAVHYRNKQFIAIWYGQWRQNEETKELVLMNKPNEWLIEEYYLSQMCRNRVIDGIVRQIKRRYSRICDRNQKLVQQINEDYQSFQWTIMNFAINQVIPKEVWEWLDNFDDMKWLLSMHREQEEELETGLDLYSAFSRTVELYVHPIKHEVHDMKYIDDTKTERLRANPTEIEQKILQQRIRSIMELILKEILISVGREYVSPWISKPFSNRKILRFKNEAIIHDVETRIITKFRRIYRDKYEISFKPLSQASTPAHLLCGYDRSDAAMDWLRKLLVNTASHDRSGCDDNEKMSANSSSFPQILNNGDIDSESESGESVKELMSEENVSYDELKGYHST